MKINNKLSVILKDWHTQHCYFRGGLDVEESHLQKPRARRGRWKIVYGRKKIPGKIFFINLINKLMQKSRMAGRKGKGQGQRRNRGKRTGNTKQRRNQECVLCAPRAMFQLPPLRISK